MRAKPTLLTTGISLLALLVFAPSVHAQAPPFLLQWGAPGTGPGEFDGPAAVSVDAAGFVYVADFRNLRIQKFTAVGGFVTQWPATGSGAATGLNFTGGVAVAPGGDVYVASLTYVRKYTSDGVLLAEWPPFTSLGAWAIAVDADGDVYVVDYGSSRVQKFTADGALITQWGGFGTGDGQLSSPSGIAVDENGMVYVVDTTNYRIQKFTGSGGFVAKWGVPGDGTGQFHEAIGAAVDAAGRVYITDALRHRVLVFTNTGEFITEWGGLGSAPGEFDTPGGVAIAGDGALYVADGHNERIQKFGPLPTPTKATTWGRLKALYR